MKAFLPVFSLCLALAAPALAASTDTVKTPEPHPDATDWFAGPAAPHLMAWDMDERGLSRWPHDPQDSYVNGVSHQIWLRVGHQFTEGSREANSVEAGLRLAARLGGDFEWVGYRKNAFNQQHKPDWLTFHAVADLSTDDLNTWEYGLGPAVFFEDRTRIGPGFQLRYERRLAAPWTFNAKYAPAFLSDGRFWHEASAGFSANYKRIGADVSYKILFNGQRNSYGPELSLRLFL